MSAERHRGARLGRLADLAAQEEDQARAVLAEVSTRLRQAERARTASLERSVELARQSLPTGLRSHLAQSGARSLAELDEARATVAAEVDTARLQVEQARVRTRSLRRVAARLMAVHRERERRVAEADWRDLVAARAARASGGRS